MDHNSTSQVLSETELWRLLRQELLPLRPSQRDITWVFNLTCEGRLLGHHDTPSPSPAWIPI